MKQQQTQNGNTHNTNMISKMQQNLAHSPKNPNILFTMDCINLVFVILSSEHQPTFQETRLNYQRTRSRYWQLYLIQRTGTSANLLWSAPRICLRLKKAIEPIKIIITGLAGLDFVGPKMKKQFVSSKTRDPQKNQQVALPSDLRSAWNSEDFSGAKWPDPVSTSHRGVLRCVFKLKGKT